MRSCYSKYINTYWLGSILLLQIGLNVFLEFKLTRSSEEKKIFKKEISSGGNKTRCWSLDAHPHFDFNCLVRKVPNGAHKCPKFWKELLFEGVKWRPFITEDINVLFSPIIGLGFTLPRIWNLCGKNGPVAIK